LSVPLGVGFYFVSYGVLSALMLLKMSFRTGDYFPSIWTFILDGVFQGGLSFVLFWTLLFNIVHVY